MADFESTPEFQALVVAAAGKPERSMGSSVIPAEPPQWGEVRTLANKLVSANANQLALHIFLIQAETNVKGFTGFRDALQNTLTLLTDQWDDMYPEPDLDDPEDMYYARVNLFNDLSMQPQFLDAIHRLPLVSVRGIGEFSARDIDISAGTVSGSEEDKARCQEGLIRGAFAESDKDALQSTLDALDALPGLCKLVETSFAEKTGQADVLSLEPLIKRIESCRTRCHEYADEHLQSAAANAADNDTESTTAEATAGSPATTTDSPAATSTLGSRAMVLASFDAILLYYQQHEPSSPVRVLTYCARDFVDKPFFEVLQALAPAYRDDLPMLLAQLQKQPLASLLSDRYARFLGGEAQPTLQAPTVALPEAAEVAPDGSAADAALAASPDAPAGPGELSAAPVIQSRQEVLDTLHDIEAFFNNAEPASPIPLIIADIRKLVGKRFVELVTEFSRLLPAGPSEAGE
ncbi:MAG: hypothetical protein HKN42_10350 [Granulosicoccus sp.]|nr:hypothetical protein [Granulosicoccus sp.]